MQRPCRIILTKLKLLRAEQSTTGHYNNFASLEEDLKLGTGNSNFYPCSADNFNICWPQYLLAYIRNGRNTIEGIVTMAGFCYKPGLLRNINQNIVSLKVTVILLFSKFQRIL